MYEALYDEYKSWYKGGSIWFYSDPHFGDIDTIAKRKNYIGDEAQVESINKKLGKNDTIVFLGDIGDVSYIKKIRGHKILIVGNHDKGVDNYKEYFEAVYAGPVFISPKILLTHEPVNFPNAINIHGHTHDGSFSKAPYFNMCAECINYTPVNINAIVESGALKSVVNIHRESINKAKKRKHN